MKENMNIDILETCLNRFVCAINKDLLEFCKKHNRIFLYGAGQYGQICLNVLRWYGIIPNGFIVTRTNTKFEGDIRVYSVYEMLPTLTKYDGVILTVKEKFQQEIIDNVSDKSIFPLFMIPSFYFQYIGTLLEPHLMSWLQCLFREKIHRSFSQEKYQLLKNLKKILIIRLDVIGDMIWTSGFFRELKKEFPEAQIDLVARPEVRSLVESCPYINKIYWYDCPLKGAYTLKMEQNVRAFAMDKLQNEKYDIAFLARRLPAGLDDLLDNVLMALYCGAKITIGHMLNGSSQQEGILLKAYSHVLSYVVEDNQYIHEVEKIFSMLQICGDVVKNKRMELWLDKTKAEQFCNNFRDMYNVNSDDILIAIGLVGRNPSRTWSAEKYNELISEMFNRYGTKVHFVLFGGADALEAAEVCCRRKTSSIINMVGKTSLKQAEELMTCCNFYVGSNTGILHIAAALRKPIVEISAHLPDGDDVHGEAPPARVGAWQVPNIVVQPSKGLDSCKGSCHETFPHCITQITVTHVENAIEKMLRSCSKHVYIAFHADGGLGDYIVTLKVVESIVSFIPDCIIDIYCEPATMSFARSIYSYHPNVKNVFSLALYADSIENYDVAIWVPHFVKVDYLKEWSLSYKSPSALKVFRKIESEQEVYTGEVIHGFCSFFARSRFWKLNRYTALGNHGCIPILDKSVHVFLDMQYLVIYEKLKLKQYITVNFGVGEIFVKLWPKEYFTILLARIREKYPNVEIVQLGAKDAEHLSNVNRYILGENLELTKYILKSALLHIDCEGGLVHLATQLGTKCAVLFGPTPMWYYGYEQNINIVSQGCKECDGVVPGWEKKCMRGLEKPECMYSITPEMVMEKITGYLDKQVDKYYSV